MFKVKSIFFKDLKDMRFLVATGQLYTMEWDAERERFKVFKAGVCVNANIEYTNLKGHVVRGEWKLYKEKPNDKR